MNRREFVKGSVIVGGTAGLPPGLADREAAGSGTQEAALGGEHVGAVIFNGTVESYLKALETIGNDQTAYDAFKAAPKTFLGEHFAFAPQLGKLDVDRVPDKDDIKAFAARLKSKLDNLTEEDLRAHWHMGTVVNLLTAGGAGT